MEERRSTGESEITVGREASLRAERREVQRARLAGSDASEVLDEVVELLREAARVGAADMLGGGMLITHVKHRKLDAARASFEEAGEALREFASELRGMAHFEPPSIALSVLDVGLDYFANSVLVHAFVQDRIHDARERAETTLDDVEKVLSMLDARHAAIGKELAELGRLSG